MNKNITKLLLPLLLLAGYSSRAQLAGGTYTINSGAATGGTNYASFSAAIAAMSSGISGPVVFNVVAGSGPYTEQVSIGNITGTSATNTIKFNGNGATVQYTSTGTYSAVLVMNGAKYVKVDSLNFKNLGTTYGYGANIYNSCNYDSITRCTFDLTTVTTTASANSMGIRIAGTATSMSSTTVGATNSYFGNNRILATTGAGGCYYGFCMYGANDNNVVANNYISNFYIYGLYCYYGANIKVLNNIVTRETKTSVGYCYGLYGGYTSGASRYTGNRVHSLGGATPSTTYCYPLYFPGMTGTAASPTLVANNAVYNMTSSPSYGLYSSSCVYTNFYHNTVDVSVPVSYSGSNYGIYIYASTNCNFKNNNVAITAGGTSTKYGYYFSSYSGNPTERNNIYVNSSQTGTQAYAYSSSAYNTLADFQAAFPTFEAGSVSVDPQFAAPAAGNLAPGNTLMFGKGVNLQTVVPADIVGQARLAAPAPGCYEFQANGTNNAGSVTLVNPVGNYCVGTYPIQASVYNAGTNNITSLTVNWSLNGVVQPPVTYTQTLVPVTSSTGQPVATITLGNATLPNTAVGLKVWTSMPNGSPDAINANDTLTDTLHALTLTVDAMKDTVCLNRGAVINLTPSSGFATGSLQWQSSGNNGATWPGVPNSDVTTLVSPNLTGNTWFRVKMTSGSMVCYSDTAKIYTTDPQLLSFTDDTARCGPGTVTLTASASANAEVKWFDDINSITPVATGTSFTTPFLGTTTNFWVGAGIPNAQPEPVNVVQAGSQTTSSSSLAPFYYYYSSTKNQFLVTAAEMTAQGYTAGYINAVGLMTNSINMPVVENINISMTATNLTSLTGFVTGLQNVYTTPAYTFQANATNYFDFQNAFYWDGASNILISFCKSNSSGSGGNTFVMRYNSNVNNEAYYYSNTQDLCAATSTSYISYYRPHMLFKMSSACETPKQQITVTVNPVPVVDLGNDINECVDGGQAVVLDAGLQPNNGQYVWDNGSTSQIRSVAQSGTYTVQVTNQFSCVNSDTVNVVLRTNPEVELGNDTSVCNGATLTLNAGSQGIEYFWGTGQTTQTITINSAGTYNVFVTNSQGCITADTITVNMQGELPVIQGIMVNNNGQNTFQFTAVNPQNVIGYDWDFGDGSPHSYQASPTHTYASSGNYIVVLNLSSSCGFLSDSSAAHIVGVNQLNVDKNELTVYPNPAKSTATILNRGALKMEQVVVYNVLGQVVYRSKSDSKDKHELQLEALSSGVYTIEVYTDKGTVARKLEIIK